MDDVYSHHGIAPSPSEVCHQQSSGHTRPSKDFEMWSVQAVCVFVVKHVYWCLLMFTVYCVVLLLLGQRITNQIYLFNQFSCGWAQVPPSLVSVLARNIGSFAAWNFVIDRTCSGKDTVAHRSGWTDLSSLLEIGGPLQTIMLYRKHSLASANRTQALMRISGKVYTRNCVHCSMNWSLSVRVRWLVRLLHAFQQ